MLCVDCVKNHVQSKRLKKCKCVRAVASELDFWCLVRHALPVSSPLSPPTNFEARAKKFWLPKRSLSEQALRGNAYLGKHETYEILVLALISYTNNKVIRGIIVRKEFMELTLMMCCNDLVFVYSTSCCESVAIISSTFTDSVMISVHGPKIAGIIYLVAPLMSISKCEQQHKFQALKRFYLHKTYVVSSNKFSNTALKLLMTLWSLRRSITALHAYERSDLVCASHKRHPNYFVQPMMFYPQTISCSTWETAIREFSLINLLIWII